MVMRRDVHEWVEENWFVSNYSGSTRAALEAQCCLSGGPGFVKICENSWTRCLFSLTSNE